MQLSCRDLTIGYDKNPIVNNINFDIMSGDYVAIVGENGAGKSTLMKTLLGLLPPIDGEIVFGDGLKKNEIGYLPQQTVVQKDFPASVWEVVLSGCLARTGLRPFYGKAEKKTAQENIERLGLTELKNRSYRELSGGQQQRVLLARALCATEKILLLDEPVSGLDPIVTAEMYDIIEKLNKDGATIIMISHDVHAALKYADKILHVGKELFFGDKTAYLSSAAGKRFADFRGEKND